MRWTTPGIHTYDWRAPTRDTCTYYVEARAPSGATLRDPSSDAYQLALSRPQISWHFLLISLLLTLTLSGVVYLWLSRTR